MPHSQTKSKRIAVIAVAAALLFVIVVIGLPLLVNAAALRPILESKLSAALGRTVKVDNLRLAIFSGGVAAEGFSIADDPAFSHNPFVQAKSIDVSVSLMPLIFSHTLNLQGITIDEPQIFLIQTDAGSWNYSSLGKPGAVAAPGPATAAVASTETSSGTMQIGSIKISHGRFSVTQGLKRPLTLENVDLEMKGISTTSALPFSLGAELAGGGTLELSGTQGPLNSADTAATPFDATLKIKHLDLVASGLIDPSAGIAGVADLEATASQKGDAVRLEGKLTAENWKIATHGSPAKVPLEFDFTVAHNRGKLAGELTRGDIHLGKALATVTGHYDIHGTNPAINFTLAAPSLPGAEIAPVLPAMDVVLPAGATLDGGTLSMNLKATGPLDRLVTTGSVGLSNVRLANFDLGSKLQTLQAIAGIRPTAHTEIQTLRTSVQSTPDSTRLDGILVVVPTLGELSGAGVISASHALDFKMSLTMAKSGGLIPGLASIGTVPFTVGGTAQDPRFTPDVNAIAAGRLGKIVEKNPAAKSLLQGLFGRKKK